MPLLVISPFRYKFCPALPDEVLQVAGECVRVAVVTIEGANANLPPDLQSGNSVYLPECGVSISVVASITVDRPGLLVLDQDDCLTSGHEVSDDEDELFDLGRDLGAAIVAYYIQGDTAGFRGCAAHPPGRRGFWVGDNATEWTFVHELTHVVGDNAHVTDTDNLMFRNTGLLTNVPPDLTSDQCERIRDDEDVGPCVLAAEGSLSFFRVHDEGTGFGPPGDQLDVEVVIRLDTEPGMAFGFQLRADENEAARAGMLDTLRTAFGRDTRVRLDYLRTGLTTGLIIRVATLS